MINNCESYIRNLLDSAARYSFPELSKEAQAVLNLFTDYSAYNKVLMGIQTGSSGMFVATSMHWQDLFNRTINIDAQPMAILAHAPVIWVYDISDTSGDPLPHQDELSHLIYPLKRDGLDEIRYADFVKAIQDYGIRYFEKKYAFNYGGCAALRGRPHRPGDAHAAATPEYDILINSALDSGSKTWSLVHELAHIFLGHIPIYEDPFKDNEKDSPTREIEAETVTAIVADTLGYSQNLSVRYLSEYKEAFPEFQKNIRCEKLLKAAEKILQLLPG